MSETNGNGNKQPIRLSVAKWLAPGIIITVVSFALGTVTKIAVYGFQYGQETSQNTYTAKDVSDLHAQINSVHTEDMNLLSGQMRDMRNEADHQRDYNDTERRRLQDTINSLNARIDQYDARNGFQSSSALGGK